MEIDIMVVTYLRGGGLSPYHYIGDILNTRLTKTYGSAVKTIEIYPRLPVPERLRPTFDDDFDRWQQRLEELPHIAFRRKINRLEIAFGSKHFDAADMDGWDEFNNGKRRVPTLSVEAIGLAGDEIREALLLIRKRIKPSDDFDVVRFLADADVALSSTPESMEEWNAVQMVADKKQKVAHAAKSPWDQLDIDWSQFHPKARDILDDPFFWDELDDISPNGNDTGAELLEEFRHWNRKNRTASPSVFLEGMVAKWGVEPLDWSLTNEKAVRQLRADDSIRLDLCNETAIALAFALLKVRGECPPIFAQMALAALTRKGIPVGDGSVDDTIKANCDDPIGLMRVKLESLSH